ncbi:MAG: hemolysin family protein [Oscillospiraceae bacterium]
MDSGSIWIIVVYAILLALSAFFSASETAYSTFNRIRMKSLAAEGNKKAEKALLLADSYDKLISTILIGNNIVNILSSSLATVLFVGWFGNLGVTLATVVTTVLVLIFGEIVPKAVAKETPDSFAVAVSSILSVLMKVFTPLNAFFTATKNLALRIIKVKPAPGLTEQELLTYVEEVREDGAISEEEEDMIRTLIEFDDVHVSEISTPRVDIDAVSMEDDPKKVAELFHETGFSRLPVYEGSVDNIIGMLLHKDFHYHVETQGKPISSIIRPVLHVTENLKISKLLRDLQQAKTHMAVVEDEYGGTQGIITMEDIIEELVGEIWDEYDDAQEEITELPDGRLRVVGLTETDDLMERFGLTSDSGSNTVGGWVSEQLGHIPEPGETFDYAGLRVTVEAMDRKRVGSVLVEVLPEPEEEPSPDSE